MFGITLGIVASMVGLIAVEGLWNMNFFAHLERLRQFSPTKGGETTKPLIIKESTQLT